MSKAEGIDVWGTAAQRYPCVACFHAPRGVEAPWPVCIAEMWQEEEGLESLVGLTPACDVANKTRPALCAFGEKK